MAAENEATVTVTLTLSVAGGGPANLAEHLVDYLTGSEHDLAEAYGPDAFGGYDGTYITHIRAVAQTGIVTVTKEREWGERKPEDDDDVVEDDEDEEV